MKTILFSYFAALRSLGNDVVIDRDGNRLYALKEQEECQIELRIFMLADSVTVALNGQAPTEGYNLRQMLEILTAQKVPMRLCKTCTDSSGISGLPLIDGIEIGTMPLLARWTVEADKVLNF